MYVTGGFDFPMATGAFDVEVGIEPVGVLMFGGNQSTVGSLVTGLSGPCVWISINGIGLDDDLMKSWTMAIQSDTLPPSGPAYCALRAAKIPISVPAEGTNPAVIDYRADSITFLPTGFRLNVTNAAPSRRPVHFIAFGEDDLQARALLQDFYGAGTDTYPFPPTTLVIATSDLVLAPFVADPAAEGTTTGNAYLNVGSGNYAEGSSAWEDVKTHTIFSQGDLAGVGREGFLEDRIFDVPSSGIDGLIGIAVMHVLSTAFPELTEGYCRYRPDDPRNPASNDLSSVGGVQSGLLGEALVWNGHGWCETCSTPGTFSAPTYLDGAADDFGDFKAVMFTSINGTIATASEWQSRFAYGVLGADVNDNPYQGCVSMGVDGSFYQSDNECAANVGDSASGVQASTGTLDGDEFSLTISKGAGFNGTWQGWGEQEEAPTSWQRRRYIANLP
jgi:hypothetical protein